MSSSPDQIPPLLMAHGRRLVLDRPLVMGVLNVTPDSFSDGGRYLEPDAAVKHVLEMVEEGADVIDIGAESSRPGAEPVPEEEELRRLIPVVREVCRRVAVPVSVDTTKAAVARQAIEAGAAIINDISALQADPAMASVVADAGAGLVLMHRQGTPKTMQQAPRYGDVVADVRGFLRERMQTAGRAGIAEDHILLDPGIGFGKNLSHNLALLCRLDELCSVGRPILIGVSRKSFIGEALDRRTGDRLMGTAAAVAVAVLRGARMVRVHEVRAMRDVVRMVDAIATHETSR
ncbi:MAG: dihydropteroate synthase [Nitrospiraceae bacterium]